MRNKYYYLEIYKKDFNKWVEVGNSFTKNKKNIMKSLKDMSEGWPRNKYRAIKVLIESSIEKAILTPSNQPREL